jgi:hypothetical protein
VELSLLGSRPNEVSEQLPEVVVGFCLHPLGATMGNS